MTLTPAEADKILATNFAPWVLDLGLTAVELDERRAVLRLPWSDRLARWALSSHSRRRPEGGLAASGALSRRAGR